MRTMILVIAVAMLTGCTDAEKANWTTLGNAGTVKCYSGGKLIYEGTSTGKIATVTNSDGWQFKDAKTGKFIRVSGDCVIEN
jgi:hypothetical protein